MNAAMNRNGQQRKSLAGQIDRLDALLDGLAAGLNESVAAVVQEAVGLAVKEAVRAVLSEVLQNTELLAQLQRPSPATAPVEAPVQPRFRWLRASCQVVGQAIGACRDAVAGAMHSAAQAVCTWIGRLVQRSQRASAATQKRVTILLTGCCQLRPPGPVVSGAAGVRSGGRNRHRSRGLPCGPLDQRHHRRPGQFCLVRCAAPGSAALVAVADPDGLRTVAHFAGKSAAVPPPLTRQPYRQEQDQHVLSDPAQ
jgi:hypothetical protein